MDADLAGDVATPIAAACAACVSAGASELLELLEREEAQQREETAALLDLLRRQRGDIATLRHHQQQLQQELESVQLSLNEQRQQNQQLRHQLLTLRKLRCSEKQSIINRLASAESAFERELENYFLPAGGPGGAPGAPQTFFEPPLSQQQKAAAAQKLLLKQQQQQQQQQEQQQQQQQQQLKPAASTLLGSSFTSGRLGGGGPVQQQQKQQQQLKPATSTLLGSSFTSSRLPPTGSSPRTPEASPIKVGGSSLLSPSVSAISKTPVTTGGGGLQGPLLQLPGAGASPRGAPSQQLLTPSGKEGAKGMLGASSVGAPSVGASSVGAPSVGASSLNVYNKVKPSPLLTVTPAMSSVFNSRAGVGGPPGAPPAATLKASGLLPTSPISASTVNLGASQAAAPKGPPHPGGGLLSPASPTLMTSGLLQSGALPTRPARLSE